MSPAVVKAPESLPFLPPEASFHADPRGKPWSSYILEKDGPIYDGRTITRRLSANHKVIFDHIHYESWGKRIRPGNDVPRAKIPLEHFRQELPLSPHHIRSILADLEAVKWISRPDPSDPWVFESHPENIALTPLREPVRKPELSQKLRARAGRSLQGHVRAIAPIAALRDDIGLAKDEGNTFPSKEAGSVEEASIDTGGAPEGNIFPSDSQPIENTARHIRFPVPTVDGRQMHFLVSEDLFTRLLPIGEMHFQDGAMQTQIYLRAGEMHFPAAQVDLPRPEMHSPAAVPCPHEFTGLDGGNGLNRNELQTGSNNSTAVNGGALVGEEEEKALVVVPPRFEDVAAQYPKERIDAAKAKTVWYGDDQQKLEAMPPQERAFAMAGLMKHLECERWKHRPDLIPLLSNFLRRRE